MPGKEGFSKIKGTMGNVSIELAGKCNVLPRLAYPNGLILTKLKRSLNYRGYV